MEKHTMTPDSIENIDRVIDALCDKIYDLLKNDNTSPSTLVNALTDLITVRALIGENHFSSSNE